MSQVAITTQARSAMANGAYDEALVAAELLLLLDDTDADGLAIKASALQNQSSHINAIEVARIGLAAHPNDLRFHRLLADCLFATGEIGAAQQIAEQGLRLDPHIIELKFLLNRVAQLKQPPQLPLRHRQISILAPSRLNRSQYHDGNPYWIERAYQMVERQSIITDLDWEMVVGLDYGVVVPDVLKTLPRLRFAHTTADAPRNQPAALNAAVAATQYSVLVFFEEDDVWRDDFLEMTLSYVDPFDFIASSQREDYPDGTLHEFHDYGTPNSWVMTRDLWDRVGAMDEYFDLHLDVDFLGRLNKTDARRVFIHHGDVFDNVYEMLRDRDRLVIMIGQMPPGSMFVSSGETPLVTRLRHDSSVMGGIRTKDKDTDLSRRMHDRLHELYGDVLPF